MAQASSSLMENLEQHLECAVCLEQYKNPKVLECLHFFCMKCIQGLLFRKDGMWKVACPACRKETEIPSGVAASLPSNFYVNNLLSMMAVHAPSQDEKRACGNCDSGDPPVMLCTICEHFLCEFCVAAHQRGRSTRAHALTSLDKTTEEGSAIDSKPTLCKAHVGEILKYFCESCDVAICRECPIVDHQGHKHSNLKDAFAKVKDNLLKRLDEARVSEIAVNKAAQGIAETMKGLVVNEEKTRFEVHCYFEEMLNAVENRRQEIFGKIEELTRTKKKGLQVRYDELQATLGVFKSGVQFIEKTLQDGSHVDVLNVKKQMLRQLEDLSSITWPLQPRENTGHILEFKKDDKIKSLLSEISKLGSVVSEPIGSSSLQVAVTVRMDSGEEGVMYNTLCGQPIEFTLIAKDQNGRRQCQRGEKFQVSIRNAHGASVYPEVKDGGNGCYRFTCTPQEEGQYTLAVSSDGFHVEGSPFKWHCEMWNLAQASQTEDITLTNGNKTASLAVSREILSKHCSVTGTLGFGAGHRLWKCSVSFHYTNSFALGVISSRQRQSGVVSSTRGRQWTWLPGKKYQPDMYDASDSSLVNVKSNDVFEFYLNCNNSKLLIVNQRTKEQDTLYGFKDDVFPVFHIWRTGSTISLTL